MKGFKKENKQKVAYVSPTGSKMVVMEQVINYMREQGELPSNSAF